MDRWTATDQGISPASWQVRRYFEIVKSLAEGGSPNAIGREHKITGTMVRKIASNAVRYYCHAKSGKLLLNGSWQSRVAMSLLQTNSLAIKAYLDAQAARQIRSA